MVFKDEKFIFRGIPCPNGKAIREYLLRSFSEETII